MTVMGILGVACGEGGGGGGAGDAALAGDPDAGAGGDAAGCGADAALSDGGAGVDGAPQVPTVEGVCLALCTVLVDCAGGGDIDGCTAACTDDLTGCSLSELEALAACESAPCDQIWEECIELVDCVGYPVCGDGACEAGECARCDEDCPGGCDCGDGTCAPGECGDCPSDCPAGCGLCSDGSQAFGEDAFGYRGCLGELGAVPPCEDISATGTPGCADDDCASTVELPFEFDFYGVPRTEVSFTSNGTLGFPGSAAYENSCSIEEDTIAVYWDDLFPPGGGGLRYQVFGAAPSRHVTFQWQVPHIQGGTAYDVRAVLREGSNDIEICYLETVTLSAETDQGASATIGIRGPSADGIELACFAPVATPGRLLRFEHP